MRCNNCMVKLKTYAEIEGTPKEIECAKGLIQVIIDSCRSFLVTELSIPLELNGAVMGSAGSTIRNMKAESGAAIALKAKVEMKGTPEEVENAEWLIIDLIEYNRRYEF